MENARITFFTPNNTPFALQRHDDRLHNRSLKQKLRALLKSHSRKHRRGRGSSRRKKKRSRRRKKKRRRCPRSCRRRRRRKSCYLF